MFEMGLGWMRPEGSGRFQKRECQNAQERSRSRAGRYALGMQVSRLNWAGNAASQHSPADCSAAYLYQCRCRWLLPPAAMACWGRLGSPGLQVLFFKL